MRLNRLSCLWIVGVYSFMSFAVAVGYAQPKPAAPPITVYQDPT